MREAVLFVKRVMIWLEFYKEKMEKFFKNTTHYIKLDLGF